MAKYVPNEDDKTYQFLKRMMGLIAVVNTTEIAAHIKNDSLKQWCDDWRENARGCLESAPLRWERFNADKD